MRLHQRRKRSAPLPLALIGAAAVFLLPAHAAGNDAGNPPPNEALRDSEITDAIEAKMIGDPSVPFHEIDVETHQGITTLSGEVDNLLARDRAVELAEAIKGVRSVVDRLEVTPAYRSDAAIESDVGMALLTDPAADSYEIGVTVNDGLATLTGSVDSWQEKSIAADIARATRGVSGVKNDITVDFDLDRSDPEIEADVTKRIAWDVRLSDNLIDAEVQDGRVTLTGWVGSAAERTYARSAVWVAGVRDVDASGLEVRWWADDETRTGEIVVQTDANIEKAVRDAMLYDPRVLSFEPEVSVRNGEVTLRGVVDNAEARRAAEMDARNTVGVWRVRNHLKVRPLQAPPDTHLMQSVRSAIARDPFLARHPITVVADDGQIALEGRVDYEYERERAERVATRINGVKSVENELLVDHNWTWRSDADLRRSIEDELSWSPFVDSDSVSVTVENGVATLTGSVEDWPEAVAAIENARDGGARRVRSRLDIESWQNAS